MKILPVVFEFLPLLVDGQVHKLPVQVYHINGRPQIRVGDNNVSFNEDGSFSSVEARLSQDAPAVAEYVEALQGIKAGTIPANTYHQPGGAGYDAEMRGYGVGVPKNKTS